MHIKSNLKNNNKNITTHPLDLSDENKQGILLDDQSTCFHYLINGHLLKQQQQQQQQQVQVEDKNKINYINFIQVSYQKDQNKYVTLVNELLKLTNEKERLYLVLGINLKVLSYSSIKKRMNPNLVISMETIERIKEIGIPVLIVGYRWCSKRINSINNGFSSNPYQIIKNINKIYNRLSTTNEKEQIKYKELIESQDKLHSFPFGKTRTFLFKNKASLNFIKIITRSNPNGLTYLHCQDSDFTSLNSISKFNQSTATTPYSNNNSDGATLPLYERCDEMIFRQHQENQQFPLVFGGCYNFTNCLNDIPKSIISEEQRINISNITDLSINLSNEIKNIISKQVSTRNIYFTEANTFIISPFHSTNRNNNNQIYGTFKRFKKSFKSINFGNVNEMGEFLIQLFENQTELNLKNQLVYDPTLCISTSTIRSGKDNFSIDKYSGGFNKENGKFTNVNIQELYNQKQSILSSRKISELIFNSFKNTEPLSPVAVAVAGAVVTNEEDVLKSIFNLVKELDPFENLNINDNEFIDNFQTNLEIIESIKSSFSIHFNDIIQVIRNISLVKLSMKLKYFESFSN